MDAICNFDLIWSDLIKVQIEKGNKSPNREGYKSKNRKEREINRIIERREIKGKIEKKGK